VSRGRGGGMHRLHGGAWPSDMLGECVDGVTHVVVASQRFMHQVVPSLVREQICNQKSDKI